MSPRAAQSMIIGNDKSWPGTRRTPAA
jgi:hypothetical protein